MAGAVRSVGLIHGLVGLGALLGLLHILVAIGLSLAQGRVISHDERLSFLTFGSIDGLVALLGFLGMYGFFTLRRWARYVLMASGLLGLGFGLSGALQQIAFGSVPLDVNPLVGLGVVASLSGLACILSVVPALRKAVNG
jgi:hypothetical protein